MQKKKRFFGLIAVLAILLTFTAGYIVYAVEVGSEDDPVISLSYLVNVFKPDIIKTIDQKIADSKAGTTSNKLIYVAVEVKAGKTIECGEGTEFILRSGQAVSVCPGANGLVDATAGLDLAGGNDAVKNHVYIVPRADGRGIKMTVDGFVMIKGDYTLK